LLGTVLALVMVRGAIRKSGAPEKLKTINHRKIRMKLNRIITLCAVAASLFLAAGSAMAQQDNGGGNGGPGGGRRGGPGGGRFDPQQMMDRVRDVLNFTNDTDWAAVQPLVQKVMDARRDVGMGGNFRALFRNRNGNGGGPGGGRGFGPQPSPEEDALQNALDSDAPSAQIKDLLAKYKASQQAKQAKLEAAQDALKAVLTPKQEAQAFLLGLVR
jgi:Spy/CpxP family protein refolding chaperone